MLRLSDNKQAFSIIEVMVIMSILSVSLVGFFALVQRNISVQKHNKNYLFASMLAQEGIEMARNYRDKNWLLNVTAGPVLWTENLWDLNDPDFTVDYLTGTEVSGVYIDPDFSANDTGTPDDYTDDAAFRLFKNNLSGLYGHDSSDATPSIYYRAMESVLSNDVNDPYLELTSIVQWRESSEYGEKTNEYKISTRLYDWR